MRKLLPILFVCLYAAVALAAQPAKDVKFNAEDGTSLSATFFEGQKDMPGIVLIHMLSGNRVDWRSYALALQEAGYHVLAVDLRGHGTSAGGPFGFKQMNEVEFRKTDQDVAASVSDLRQRPGVDGSRIALVGASIGANAAVIRCTQDPNIKAVVALSPGRTYRGINAEAALPGCKAPMFFVVSENDTYAANSARVMAKAAGDLVELKVLKGQEHGTNMLKSSKDLAGLMKEFLDSKLK